MRSELKQKLDYSDYSAIPPDGNRYEILSGELYVTPAPSPQHQRISKRLQRQLEDYFERRDLAEVFNAPIDLILTARDVVQPDLLVVADSRQISERGIEGVPLLVVEILSPSTRETDSSVKARRYAQLGVPHYWLVDPDAKSVTCHRLEAGVYRPVIRIRGNHSLTHPDWDDLVVDLEAVWR